MHKEKHTSCSLFALLYTIVFAMHINCSGHCLRYCQKNPLHYLGMNICFHFRFCGKCSALIKLESRYCWKCKTDLIRQKLVIRSGLPPANLPTVPAVVPTVVPAAVPANVLAAVPVAVPPAIPAASTHLADHVVDLAQPRKLCHLMIS